MLDATWLRLALLVANLSVIAGTLDRRALGPRTPTFRESPAMTALYDFYGAHGLFFVLAALGLALGVADLVQRLRADRPLFGPDGRPVVLLAQVIAPAPFAVALAFQAAVTAAAIAAVLLALWLLLQVLSG